MAGVLTTGSSVRCGHGGTVRVSSSAKLSVAGQKVLVADGIDGKSVSTCGTPTTDKSKACTSVIKTTAGAATKLTAGSMPVYLDTLAGTTDGVVGGTTPQTLLAASAGQSKLTAT
jgi:hypothetical protein